MSVTEAPPAGATAANVMFTFATAVEPPMTDATELEIVNVGTTVKFRHSEDPSREAVRISGVAVKTEVGDKVAVPL